MKDGNLKLLACYEGEPYDGEHTPFHQLHGHLSDQGYWKFLVAQCDYMEESFSPSNPQSAVDFLVSLDEAVLGGGLIAIKGKFRLYPGCCCGIETWSEWKEIKPDGASPWLGHDPDAWIDTSLQDAVLHNGLESEVRSLEVSYQEIESALYRTERDLREFLVGLQNWLVEVSVTNAEELPAKISEWYKIAR